MKTGQSNKLRNRIKYSVLLKKNDRDCGFTLVELVVVIAIMAVLMSFFITGLGQLTGLASKQCTRQIKQELGQVRIKTMGKEDIYVRIYKDAADNCWYITETAIQPASGSTSSSTVTSDPEKIGSSRVTVTGTLLSAGTGAVLRTDDDMEIRFDRETGGLKEISDPSGNYYVSRIVITSGSHVHTLTISKLTGKINEE